MGQGGRSAQPGDVICHNDVSRSKTVVDGERVRRVRRLDLKGSSTRHFATGRPESRWLLGRFAVGQLNDAVAIEFGWRVD